MSGAIGFKNGTDGNMTVALNALVSASSPHRFLGINPDGQVSVIHTKGNRYGHIVLRGGSGKPNYSSAHIQLAEKEFAKAELNPAIMVDCSHANSLKDPANQPKVLEDVRDQILRGNKSIIGLMIESHLEWGNQKIPPDLKDLKYGVSITDACIDWKTTESCLRNLSDSLKDVLKSRIKDSEKN